LTRLLASLFVVAVAAACSTGIGRSSAPVSPSPAKPATYSGKIGAAGYTIVVPAAWNRTLVLYSHGYQAPGSPVGSAPDVANNPIGGWLLDRGYALAASSYSSAGWAVEQAVPDQIAVLDAFTARIGRPRRVIAWGHSLGGLVTAALIQEHPDRFAGALAMCGVLAGGVATWNVALDAAFALRTLLSPQSTISLVHISDPQRAASFAAGIESSAQDTVAGRARLALVAAIADLPGWFDPAQREPAATDYAAQEVQQYRWLSQVDLGFSFQYRAELERRAGGNPSWNTGVDYSAMLARSRDQAEVSALYAAARLDLSGDLARLGAAPRIAADAPAVAYLARNVTFTGRLSVPVLSLHTTGDGLVPVESESAYASAVLAAGSRDQLRQGFVHRAGHCFFTPAETIAAFQFLEARLDSGRWPAAQDSVAGALNSLASGLGDDMNRLPIGSGAAPPAFVAYQPGSFPRS
jgi:pimeloyl-ACP methyl ester carboxylesterase